MEGHDVAASEGAAGPKRRKSGGRSKTSQKAEVVMPTRKDIQDTHLAMILKERGPLTAEASGFLFESILRRVPSRSLDR